MVVALHFARLPSLCISSIFLLSEWRGSLRGSLRVEKIDFTVRSSFLDPWCLFYGTVVWMACWRCAMCRLLCCPIFYWISLGLSLPIYSLWLMRSAFKYWFVAAFALALRQLVYDDAGLQVDASTQSSVAFSSLGFTSPIRTSIIPSSILVCSL
ncbi:hypothetical protein FA15DRAFT_337553 [Coprinopsis marcescibilis]|uniref:Uncharacterized protein n=1 Tax=Coprinopsis marcescibilis TaxID=230819 RepID=A0A5C3KB80_COPMA|nr:hypothetical protein FA15DRAFT_337553 [Coprinopsis marcescibilis]